MTPFGKRESTSAMPFEPLDELYRDIVLDHYRTPRGNKTLDHCDVQNDGKNPLCGDEVTLCLKLQGDRIEDLALRTRGCSICTASGSMLAETLTGKTCEESQSLIAAVKHMMHGEAADTETDLGDLEALSGVRKFPVRVKCALLPWTTLEDALAAWRSGNAGARTHSTTEENEAGNKNEGEAKS